MTSIERTRTEQDAHLRDYDRAMLRSAVVSLFWAAIVERRRHGRFTLQMLADRLGVDKSAVSRWFSNEPPNWTLDTIADIADALDLELEITARERGGEGRVLTPAGAREAGE